MTGIALKVSTAAAELDVSERTIRDAIGRGELPAYRVGTKGTGVRIDRDDLREWLRSRPRVGAEDEA